ncbi:MAG: hypothetical protein CL609_24070 [Anaerolineaceae bacterium]|nr:hypothetical protein [Anaerolineaceae bacterium]
MRKFEVWIGEKFNTTHERVALDSLIQAFESEDFQEEKFFILANFSMNGKPVDLALVKNDAFVIVELKDCEDAFTASENNEWEISNGKYLQTGNRNPFRQVEEYRNATISYLVDNAIEIFKQEKERSDFYHLNGFVVISPDIHPKVKNKIPEYIRWFRLTGLKTLPKYFFQTTSNKLKFTNGDIRRLIKLLNLVPINDALFINQFKVPFQVNNQYIKNEEFFAEVREVLTPQNKPVIITGLGGSGKTQFAVQYAYENRGDFPEGVFWINAANHLIDEFASLAEKLGLKTPKMSTSEAQKIQNAKSFVERVVDSENTLLIFDNINYLTKFFQPMEEFSLSINQFKCKILGTCIIQSLTKNAEFKHLPELTNKQAAEFLLNKMGRMNLIPFTDVQNAHEEIKYVFEICRQLGNHPLALEIAGSYLSYYSDVTLEDYIQLLSINRTNLLQSGEITDATNHSQNIGSTLLSHIEQIQNSEEERLLHCISLLNDSNYLSLDRLCLFYNGKQFQKLNPADPFIQSLNKLVLLNLVKRIDGGNRIWVHPLVMDFLNEFFKEDFIQKKTFFTNFQDFYYKFSNIVDHFQTRSVSDVLKDYSYAIRLKFEEEIDIQIEQFFMSLSIGADNFTSNLEECYLLQQIRNIAFHNQYDKLLDWIELYLEPNNLAYIAENKVLKNRYSALHWKLEFEAEDIKPLADNEKFLTLAENGDLFLGNAHNKEIQPFYQNLPAGDGVSHHKIILSPNEKYLIIIATQQVDQPITESDKVNRWFTYIAKVFNLKNKEYIIEFTEKQDGVLDKFVFLDDETLVYESNHHEVIVFDILQRKIKTVLTGHTEPLVMIETLRREESIISADKNRVLIWNLSNNTIIKEFTFSFNILEIKILQSKNWLFVYGENDIDFTYVEVIDIRNLKSQYKIENAGWIIENNPNHREDAIEIFKQIPKVNPDYISLNFYRNENFPHFTIHENRQELLLYGTNCEIVFDLKTGKKLNIIKDNDAVKSLEIVSDFYLILDVWLNENGVPPMRVYDPIKDQTYSIYSAPTIIDNYKVSCNKNYVYLLGENRLTVLDFSQLMDLVTDDILLLDIFISPNNDFIVGQTENFHRFALIDLVQRTVNLVPHDHVVSGFTFSLDGKTLIYQCDDKFIFYDLEHKIKTKSIDCDESLSKLIELPDGKYKIVDNAIHGQDPEMFSWDDDGLEIIIKPIKQLKNDYFQTINGGYRCEYGKDQMVRFYDLDSDHLLHELFVDSLEVSDVQINFEGTHCCFKSVNNYLQYWDLSQDRMIFQRQFDFDIHNLSLSENHTCSFLDKSGMLYVWDLIFGKQIGLIFGPFTKAKISPNGKFLLALDNYGFPHYLTLENMD